MPLERLAPSSSLPRTQGLRVRTKTRRPTLAHDTLTSVLTQPGELGAFLEHVTEQRGDPCAAVCQVFVPWLAISDGLGDLVPDFDPVERVLILAINQGMDSEAIQLPISEDLSPQIDEIGR